MSWWGKYLFINLTERKWDAYHVNEVIVRKYLGGNGIGAYLLYKFCKESVDPLSGE
ncbi:MAG: hypothetical protein NZ527_01315, partial [Hydrogenobacter thermophilus]|nr:hypothetical protein [Hydrogenobacter thermophilus]